MVGVDLPATGEAPDEDPVLWLSAEDAVAGPVHGGPGPVEQLGLDVPCQSLDLGLDGADAGLPGVIIDGLVGQGREEALSALRGVQGVVE